MEFEQAMIDSGWRVKQQIIWVKNQFAFGRADYHWKHEPIFYAVKEERNSKWYGDRTGTTVWRDKKPEDMSKEELIELFEAMAEQTTAWEIDKDPTSVYRHPTQKPVALAERAIRNSSRPGDAVIEPFSGSGSTLIAAHRAARRCFAIEFEPEYVQLGAQRMRDYTGETEMRLNGKTIDWDNFIGE
jgi:DNA modification methylase